MQRAYTADGLTASLTIARNNTTFNVTNLAYDGLDRLSTTTHPDSSIRFRADLVQISLRNSRSL